MSVQPFDVDGPGERSSVDVTVRNVDPTLDPIVATSIGRGAVRCASGDSVVVCVHC